MDLRIRLLGPVAIAYDGKPVAIASKKARALIGYLALRQGTAISRDVVTGLLWGERSEGQARASLRQTLSELRRSLPGSSRQAIIASKETVSWATGSAWIDVTVLETAAGSEDDKALRDAAELIGGELMEGLSTGEAVFEQWLATERERLRLVAGSIYARLMGAAERRGRLEEALSYGLKLLSLDPLQEHVHRAVMRHYVAQGRHDAALAQFERCRRELMSQLGVSPETETDDLARSIRKDRRDVPPRLKVLSPNQEAGRDKWPIQPDRPSIAVLPFINMSSDAEHEYFADGLTEDLITALSRINSFMVIARTSTFTYKGRPTNAKLVAEELGVRYVMEGSVRRAGDRLRVTAQLVDAATGHQIWSERYDRSLADLFDIQDEITRSVAASTQTQIQLAERYAAESRPSVNFKARDLVARAEGRLYDQTPEAVAEASELVEKAIRIDSSNPTAHRMRASVLLKWDLDSSRHYQYGPGF